MSETLEWVRILSRVKYVVTKGLLIGVRVERVFESKDRDDPTDLNYTGFN